MKSSNLVVFLVKTAIMFLIFWLLNSLMTTSQAFSNLPNWALWLILAAVASAADFIIDVVIKPESKLGNYTQYARL